MAKDKNGRWLDPNKIPLSTKQSLQPRANQPKSGYYTVPMAGSGLPGRKVPPTITPPKYTKRPWEDNEQEEPIIPHQEPTTRLTDAPMPGSGMLPPELDPVLGNPLNGFIKPQPLPSDFDPETQARALKAVQQRPEHDPNAKIGSPGFRFPTQNKPAAGTPAASNPLDRHGPDGAPTAPALFTPTYNIPVEANVTDVKALAKLYTREALAILAEIMHDEKANANARVNAAENILNRGWGKPEVQVTQTIRRSVDQFSDEEIMSILSSAATVVEDLNLTNELNPPQDGTEPQADDGNGPDLGGNKPRES